MRTGRLYRLGLVLVTWIVLAGAASGCHRGGYHGRMQRYVSKKIDKVLDEANVTPEQRVVIHGVRDRLAVLLVEQQVARRAMVEQALQLFETDMSPARIQALRAQQMQQAQVTGDAVVQALQEVYRVLTPEQRLVVTHTIRKYLRYLR